MNGPEAPSSDVATTADQPTVATPAIDAPATTPDVPTIPDPPAAEPGWAPWNRRTVAPSPGGNPPASGGGGVGSGPTADPETATPSTFRVQDAAIAGPPSRFDPFSSHYSSTARTPLPEMVAAVAVMASTFFIIRWALTDVSNPSVGPSTTWWDLVTASILQDRRLSIVDTDGGRVWWAVGAMILSLLVLVLWSRRIGVNNRASGRYFGAVLPLLALPGWWILPLIVPEGRSPDRNEAITRLAITVLVLVSQALFTRWVFVHKVWRSGELPFEPAALLLWVPLAVAGAWFYGAQLWTIVAQGADGRGHSGWRPTETMQRGVSWATRGTGIALLVVLIAVTVVQHAGIRRDRRANDERMGLHPPDRDLAPS